MSNNGTVRRGSRVLSYISDVASVGHVEGVSQYRGVWFHIARFADGLIAFAPRDAGWFVAIDGDTHVVPDCWNNINRLCNVRGDAAAGYPSRCWQVVAAVSGSRYLVRHLDTNAVRVVDHREMTNLY